MRADTLRTYKTVHTWSGIVAGLALFIAFYAGALTMFKGPLARWAAPPVEATSGDLAAADALVAATLAARPDARADFTLHLGDGVHQPHRMTWKPRGEPPQQPWSATLAPDGALQVRAQRETDIGEFVDVVHRTAGLPVDLELGTALMGLVSALYMVAIVSGVIVLWPTLVKDFFAFRVGRNLKRMWLDAHNVIGIVSLPFHVVMALSAVVFGLHDVIYDAQKAAVYGDRFEQIWSASGPFAAVPPDAAPAAALPPAALLARVQAQVPGLEAHAVRFRGAGTAGGVAWVTGAQPCCMPRSAEGGHVLVSAVDGGVRHTEYLAGRQSGWMASVSAFFSLHFGTYGGSPVRWGYFFLGLAGAFLFYSGNLLWIESRRRADRRRPDAAMVQKRSTRWMAAATVGVCLGCVAGLSLGIAAGKWLHGHVADLDAWHRSVYLGVFAGCVAWACARGAARAAVELLWFAAAATLAIPLATLVGVLWPGSGLWAHRDAVALGVDLVAVVGAMAFVMMARATARRQMQGEQQSVWSATRPQPPQLTARKA